MTFVRIRGFTLVEMMVSLTIAVLLLTSSTQLILQAAKANRIGQLDMELQESATIAKLFLERDIKKAGFFAGIQDLEQVSGSSDPVFYSQHCKKGGENLSRNLKPKVFGLNGFAKAFYCLEKHVPGSDILLLHYMEAVNEVSNKTSEKKKLYIKASLDEARLFQAEDINHYKNKVDAKNFSFYQSKTYVYYLRETGRSCDGHPVLGLFREYNGDDGYLRAEEIVSGVEQLQFQYFVDGEIKNANEIEKEAWNRVGMVSVSLLMRSLCPEAQPFLTSSERTYQLADIEFKAKHAKFFFRKTFSFDVALRN